VRDVLAIRLSAAEREQITAAATRLGLRLSGFVRQSALQSSAVVEKKVSVKEPQPAEPERELVVVELEPSGHWVDGEFVQR
jgi:uncharacterized protein (DUF1778 family)